MKLLVTTDFSVNSKGAIRYAQSLAKQSKEIEVTFYHAIQFMKPSIWADNFFVGYKLEETERLTAELKKFVHATIGKDKGKFLKITFKVDSVLSTENEILKYAEKNKMDYICIATQGAGILRKIMGTHTSHIIKNSKIPVLVIPSHYRVKPLKKAVYLSDLENLKKEVNKLVPFSTALNINLEVVHYPTLAFDQKKFESNKTLINSLDTNSIKLKILKSNHGLSLVERVSKYVIKSKPELLIMFTKRERGFFESIFLPSKTAELTFSTKVPVLVYSK